MQELVIGYVHRRGLVDETLFGDKGIQTTYGKRNAVCQTATGRKFHIRDYSWCWVGSTGCKVPRFKSRRGNFIEHFPVKGEVVYALVDFSIKGECGPNPDAQAWAMANRYERGIARVLGMHYVPNQPEVISEIREIVRWVAKADADLEALEKTMMHGSGLPTDPQALCLRHTALVSFYRHYVLKTPADKINNLAPS